MNKVWIAIKFLYSYIAYWFVGLAQEDFYISKGEYFADLGKYHSAIKCYKKALEESEMSFLYALIGWCYMNIEEDTLALENYRKAYEKIKKHYVTIPIAYLEMENGNRDECKEVFSNIRETIEELPEESLKNYEQVKQEFQR